MFVPFVIAARQTDRNSPASVEEMITVWRVGSPHTGNTPATPIPPHLQQQAESMGIRINVQAFPAEGLAQKFFDAYKNGQAPDVLCFDNFGIIDGITTPHGTFVGIASDGAICRALVKVIGSLGELIGQDREGREFGWAYLVTGSAHAEAARRLALRPPECNPDWRTTPLTKDLEKSATVIARAYLQADRPTLVRFEDDDRVRTDIDDPNIRQVAEMKTCGYWGNGQLAFAPVIASYESSKAIGHLTLLMALRKHRHGWMLLTADTDPITANQFVGNLPALAHHLQTPEGAAKKIVPAKLLAPEDGQFPKAENGQRFGDFVWRPSPSPQVVAQIIEFAYNGDARLFLRFFSGKSPLEEQISAGTLWTTRGMWRWRVWSISGHGDVVFSDARSFTH
jgi:hypothetical protein